MYTCILKIKTIHQYNNEVVYIMLHINKANYIVKLIDKKLAKQVIIENHYSHKWTSCKYAFGLYDNNILLGLQFMDSQ